MTEKKKGRQQKQRGFFTIAEQRVRVLDARLDFMQTDLSDYRLHLICILHSRSFQDNWVCVKIRFWFFCLQLGRSLHNLEQ